MKNVPSYQTNILNDALNHLDPDAEGFKGSEACEAALRDPALRNYLQSWVLPYLKALRDNDVPKWMRDCVAGVTPYRPKSGRG